MNTETDLKKEIDLYIQPTPDKTNNTDVNLLYLDHKQLSGYLSDVMYSKSLLFILVLSGNSKIEINFKDYLVEEKNILLLSQGHFFKIRQISNDFKCIMLYIGNEYIEEMYPTDMLYNRTKYNAMMYNLPLVYLSGEELKVLQERLELIENEIKNTGHMHQKKLILYTIRIFFLELSGILEKKNENKTEGAGLSRNEVYFQKFLDLLFQHYQREHLVEFYARALHLSPHYLTIIVKKLTGQTVSDLIFLLLFSEAKLQLQNPDISIQQIAEHLNFSDQSAFGKFFKKKSGKSPKEYRQMIA